MVDGVTTKRFTGIRIDEDLLEGLDRLKERDGTPVAESIRRAIRAYLVDRAVVVQKAERKRAATRKRS